MSVVATILSTIESANRYSQEGESMSIKQQRIELIRQVVADAGRKVPVKEIAEMIGLSVRVTGVAVQDGVAAGILKVSRHGNYKTAPMMVEVSA